MTALAQTATGRTILVVQHHKATRKALCAILTTAGYDVMETADCAAALELAAHRRPDLVIQDLVLPDMDGLELASSLRARFGDAAVPIICISGFLSRAELVRATPNDFTRVLVKPVDPVHLLEIVRHYVALPVEPGCVERQRLLLIDDDPLQLDLTQRRLSSAGFDVLMAPDGVTGLELARQRRPAAIVSDVHMPNMDGFALCLAVRRDKELGATPVILSSWAYWEAADRTLATRVGASALLSKAEGLEAVTRAVLASLEAPMPAVDFQASELADGAHVQRAIRQLEQQVQDNAQLLQRSALRDAQLAVLAGITEALASNGAVDGVLGDVLAACLDMAGISRGALYLTKGEHLELELQIGFSEGEAGELRKCLRCAAYLETVVAYGAVVLVPSPLVPVEITDRLVRYAGVSSLLLVPVRWGAGTYGLMVLGSRMLNIMAEDALVFASTLGAQMGLAIGLAQTFGRLARSEERYRNLTANANDAILILDAGGAIIEVNRRITEMLGYASDVLVGRHLRDFALPGRGNDDSQSYADSLVSTDGRPSPIEILKADGGLALVEFSLTPFEAGGDRLVLAIGRDVTEQMNAQTQLMTSDRMASVGTLAAGVAHEINNPLAGVIANLDFALEDLAVLAAAGTPPVLGELELFLRDARSAAERVRVIVRDLKIFSRAEDDSRTAVDTRQALESTLRMAWNEIRHRAQLVKAYGDVPLVYANESRLGQVFLNLIINAAQAIPEGRADVNQIHITTSTDAAGWVVIEIRDSGPGMSRETLNKLFTPFFTTKPAGVGTGLGLVICQRIVTDLGGKLSVESKLGAGTTFKLVLPAASIDSRADAPVAAIVLPTRRGRLLVVDDDEMLRSVIGRALARDHDVQLASCANDALATLDAGERYDVILCDMMMPIVSGEEFYEQVAKRSGEQAERIVFVTGGVFSAQARDFLSRIPNLCIEKPFDTLALRTLVNLRVS